MTPAAIERRVIVVAELPLDDDNLRRLRDAAPGFEIVSDAQRDDGLVTAAEVYAGHLRPDQIARASKLRWNHLWTAGADADLSPEMRGAAHVVVTSSAGNGAIPLAEHAMMLMLMLDRDAPRWMAAQQSKTWDRFRHRELAGQTVGIVGMGAAGRDLARKCAAFHMRVIGLRQNPDLAADDVSHMYGADEITTFAGECDYLVIAAPLTESTLGMINAPVIAAMRPAAAIVNISRGEIIDEVALREAFDTGRIARAGLDAHNTEPLPADSPWWTQPGVIVTPHNGATTPQTLTRGLDIFVDNVARYVAGATLRNAVDKNAGYAPA